MKVFILFYYNRRGKECHMSTVFTDAASALNMGEQLVDKGDALNYGYASIQFPYASLEEKRVESVKL
jgi:hypothetical protein